MFLGSLFVSQLPAPPERNLQITYHVVVENKESQPTNVKVWIPIFQSNDRQSVTLTTQDFHGGRLTTEPKYGNRMLYRELSLGPNSEQKIDLNYTAAIREWINPAAKNLDARVSNPGKAPAKTYLVGTSMIPLDGKLANLASQVSNSASGSIGTARNIYDFLIDRMDYNYKAPGAGKGDAQWACDSRTGDCTDYHSLFIGLSRIKGIPAEHFFGVALNPAESQGTSKAWHCWAEFWTQDSGWCPIDASEADKHPDQKEYLFGGLSTRCLQITHGRDVNLVPKQQGPVLNFFATPYAESNGQPYLSTTWTCDYSGQAK